MFVWIISDFAPIVYLFRVHHNNFISFEGQEVLETEDDDQSQFTHERLSLFKCSQAPRLENSMSTGYIYEMDVDDFVRDQTIDRVVSSRQSSIKIAACFGLLSRQLFVKERIRSSKRRSTLLDGVPEMLRRSTMKEEIEKARQSGDVGLKRCSTMPVFTVNEESELEEESSNSDSSSIGSAASAEFEGSVSYDSKPNGNEISS